MKHVIFLEDFANKLKGEKSMARSQVARVLVDRGIAQFVEGEEIAEQAEIPEQQIAESEQAEIKTEITEQATEPIEEPKEVAELPKSDVLNVVKKNTHKKNK